VLHEGREVLPRKLLREQLLPKRVVMLPGRLLQQEQPLAGSWYLLA